MSVSITLARGERAHEVKFTPSPDADPISWRIYASAQLNVSEVCNLVENQFNVKLTPISLTAIVEDSGDGGVKVAIHPAPFNPDKTCLDKAEIVAA